MAYYQLRTEYKNTNHLLIIGDLINDEDVSCAIEWMTQCVQEALSIEE